MSVSEETRVDGNCLTYPLGYCIIKAWSEPAFGAGPPLAPEGGAIGPYCSWRMWNVHCSLFFTRFLE